MPILRLVLHWYVVARSSHLFLCQHIDKSIFSWCTAQVATFFGALFIMLQPILQKGSNKSPTKKASTTAESLKSGTTSEGSEQDSVPAEEDPLSKCMCQSSAPSATSIPPTPIMVASAAPTSSPSTPVKSPTKGFVGQCGCQFVSSCGRALLTHA